MRHAECRVSSRAPVGSRIAALMIEADLKPLCSAHQSVFGHGSHGVSGSEDVPEPN